MHRCLPLGFLLALCLVAPPARGAARSSGGRSDGSSARASGGARSTRPTAERMRAQVAASRPRFPSVALFGAHVGEALAYRPRDERGRVKKESARQLERLLRCRQTGQRHRLHPRLGEALYQIGRHFAGHRVAIYSGFRPRAFCTRAHSRHMTGSAVDFHVEGVSNEALIAYLRKAFHPAGVGYYPHGVHVHLDVERGMDTYWVDPGPPASDPARDPVLAAPEPAAEAPLSLPAPRDTAPIEVPAAAGAAVPAEAEPVAATDEEPASLGEPPAAEPSLGALPNLPEAEDEGSSEQ